MYNEPVSIWSALSSSAKHVLIFFSGAKTIETRAKSSYGKFILNLKWHLTHVDSSLFIKFEKILLVPGNRGSDFLLFILV